MTKIEKGVPLPPKKPTRVTYPIREMEIGDSFAIELPKDEKAATAQRASATAVVQYYKRKYKIKCVTRTIKENGKTKIRIWRTE